MKNKLVVVTDLGSLKAYRLERDDPNRSPRLELLEDVEMADAHEKLTDVVSDLAGRFGKGGGPNSATAMGERHNIQLEHRRRLVRRLAERLNQLIRKSGAEGCYFAASKEINYLILKGLEAHARARIEKNLIADLTKLSKSALLKRFVPA